MAMYSSYPCLYGRSIYRITALPHLSPIHHIHGHTYPQYFQSVHHDHSIPAYGHNVYRITALPAHHAFTVAHIILQHFPPTRHGLHSISDGHSIYRITALPRLSPIQYYSTSPYPCLYGHDIYRITALPTCTVAHIILQHFHPYTMATVSTLAIVSTELLHFPPALWPTEYYSTSTHTPWPQYQHWP